ncbi:hypothetical protein [Streptomyces sp. NPDC052107]|uniref:hypothetical protein n=1 Tax=Streptomyces sp. NPDC052107 TaxID=3155632 RepID=UPI00341B4145
MRKLLEEGADPEPGTRGVFRCCARPWPGTTRWPPRRWWTAGADPDLVLPDGTTPLWRAVDGGSPAVFSAVLAKEPRPRLPQEARERLLGLARHWAAALRSVSGDDDLIVRLEAAHGLVLREDPEAKEAVDRVGPLGEGFEHDHRAHALAAWRWRRKQQPTG